MTTPSFVATGMWVALVPLSLAIASVLMSQEWPRAPAAADYQGDYEEHQENKEQYLRDAYRGPGNPKEAKGSGDQRDDQKYDSVVEHDVLPGYACHADTG
jgi:hypothetical protein